MSIGKSINDVYSHEQGNHC